jgi:hypothetical protein
VAFAGFRFPPEVISLAAPRTSFVHLDQRSGSEDHLIGHAPVLADGPQDQPIAEHPDVEEVVPGERGVREVG